MRKGDDGKDISVKLHAQLMLSISANSKYPRKELICIVFFFVNALTL